MGLIICGLVIVGHVMLCIGAINRLHATAFPPLALRVFEFFVAAWFVAFFLLLSRNFDSQYSPENVPILLQLYMVGAIATLALGAGRFARIRSRPAPSCLLSSNEYRLDVGDSLGGVPACQTVSRILNSQSWNESLELVVSHKTLAVKRLPEAMSGFRIAQWSDMHFTGRIGREYFEFVVRETQRLQADMIVITGDFHNTWDCLDWFATTVGALRAREGVYFILGNHDLRTGQVDKLKSHLESFGLRHVGGKVLRRQVAGGQILLSGNELPWFRPAPISSDLLEGATQCEGMATFSEPSLRLLLSHSPDQILWARRYGFDLVLAGHTHGGQICLPLLGPILCPSRYGVKYAEGVFEVGQTILHVCRGLSGGEPIRFRCPPELACLELRASGHLTERRKR